MSPHFRRNSNKDFNCFSQRSVDKERPIIEDDHHKCKMKRKVFFIWKTKKLDFFEKLTNEKKTSNEQYMEFSPMDLDSGIIK